MVGTGLSTGPGVTLSVADGGEDETGDKPRTTWTSSDLSLVAGRALSG
jgi:hypothetical protein